MGHRVHNEASDVAADSGEVQMDGPGGIVVSMTPEAASETAKRLEACAGEASTQVAHPDVAPIEDIPPDTISL